MGIAHELGKKGELLAADYLGKQGYTVLEKNWRYGRLEIDIICKKNETLVFVEVKTRSTDYFGEPEESVNGSKQQYLLDAAEAYMEETGWQGKARIDVVSIFSEKGMHTMKHIEDAFQAH